MAQEARALEKISEVQMHMTGTCGRLAIPVLHSSGSSQNTDTRRREPAREMDGAERGPRGGVVVKLVCAGTAEMLCWTWHGDVDDEKEFQEVYTI